MWIKSRRSQRRRTLVKKKTQISQGASMEDEWIAQMLAAARAGRVEFFWVRRRIGEILQTNPSRPLKPCETCLADEVERPHRMEDVD